MRRIAKETASAYRWPSDDPESSRAASRLVRDAGFDPVIVGALARGKEFEPGTPPYNTGMSGRELRELWP